MPGGIHLDSAAQGKKDSSVAVRSQQVSMQDAGFESITLEPSGSELLLTAKASEGISLPAPVIASNGQELLISFRGLAGPTRAARHGWI